MPAVKKPAVKKPAVKKVGLIGGGVIGSGWAARLLINGINVHLYDPAINAQRIDAVLDNALRAYRKMTLAPIVARGALTLVDSVQQAVVGMDFIQESGPERIDVKNALMREIGDHADAEVIIASSSSGLLPSAMQEGVNHPQRVIVGHPFNPVYLMPLVEIVGGRQTTDQVKQAAAEFYQNIGMHPLIVKREIEAFLADRMMEALWREALHLLNEGVATVTELDQAICYGAGIRWAFMGPFETFRIAGGDGGMRHFMAQFGPSLKWPWTRFDGPELTDQLLDTLVAQSDDQAAGRSILELERKRDDCIVSVLQALRANDYAAGKTLNRYEEKLYEAAHQAVMSESDVGVHDVRQPLKLHTDSVQPEWTDYNNHMTESRYLQVFGDASDALFRYLGVNQDYHAQGFSYYTAETHINYIREVAAGQLLYVTTQILGGDSKRLHIFHSMHLNENLNENLSEDDTLLATTEQMLLHVNTNQGRVCPAQADVAERVAKLVAAQAALRRPRQAGRSIGRK
ncbi:carnitine 3-dehydrogenase [Candidatus Spongiihabitans sp.]|uniref:carnitine 3-dehydrogenase n=1 Tax=Candidatus Spongiihabitans sp. TaxID=3101308 RepID=UPI003C7C0E69